MQLSCAIITLQIFWAKPGNPREGGRVQKSNEWGGRSREGEARAKPGNQLVLNKIKVDGSPATHNILTLRNLLPQLSNCLKTGV